MKGLKSALAVLALTAAVAVPAAAAPTNVSFRTSDGVQIAASFYQAARRPAPCVILVHMLTRTREDWHAVASRLADSGISALAIDLRGHGASGADPRMVPNPDDLSSDVLDIEAARAFLASRPDLGVTGIGIAGASVSANLAIVAAASDGAIRSIALLSPGLDYRNIRTEAALRKYGERPALLVTSDEDSYPTRSIRRLQKAGTGTREVVILNGAGHGTVMATRQPHVASLLVDWFQRTLGG